MIRRGLILAAGLGVLATPGLAQSPDSTALPVFHLPPVRTTAPRLRPAPAVPGARTILDRAWLDRRDPDNLAEALLPVSGLRITGSGDGVSRGISVRGLGSERTAILLDGHLLNTAQGGGVDLASIDLDQLSHVEITRGAMGALYGPYALAGAVNLVRRTDRSPATARILGGSENRLLIQGLWGQEFGRVSAQGALRWETLSPHLETLRGRSRGLEADTRLRWHPAWASALELAIDHRQSDRDLPGSSSFPTPAAQQDDRSTVTTGSARGLTVAGTPGTFDASFRASWVQRDYEDPAHPLGPVADTHRNRRVEAEAGWKTVDAGHRLELKAQAARDRLDSTTDGTVFRDRASLAVLGERSWRRWSVAAAVRGDVLERIDPRATVRISGSRTLAGSVDAGSWLALRAGVGTGFRPPTFDDLFWPARASAAGNPDLLPERSLDADAGIEMRLADRTRVQLTAFHNRVRDLIQWTPGADGVWRPHNVGEARIRGLELEGSSTWPGTPIRIDGALTWLDAEDATGDPVTGGRQLVGRSRWTGFGELSWEHGPWTFGVGARGVDRVPLTAANSKWVDGYLLWHSRIRWRVHPALRLELEGRNLADTRYEDVRGYPTSGREVLAGVRFAPGGGS